MDFLVVGLGLGALAILSGIVTVTFLAWRSERAAQRATNPEEQRYYAAVVASRNAGGQALIASGSVILLATVGAVAGSLDDQTGSLLVATTVTVAAIGLLVRDFLYRARHPMPRRPRARPLEMAVADLPTRTAPLTAAPSATASVAVASPSSKQEEETAPDEAAVALVAEPVPEEAIDEPAAALADVAADMAVPDPDSLPEEADVGSDGERAVIDVSYSFMRDDDPAAGARSAPYSFMTVDDPGHASGEPEAANGARVDRDEAAAIVEATSRSDEPDSGKLRKGRPALRLVGKGRSPNP